MLDPFGLLELDTTQEKVHFEVFTKEPWRFFPARPCPSNSEKRTLWTNANVPSSTQTIPKLIPRTLKSAISQVTITRMNSLRIFSVMITASFTGGNSQILSVILAKNGWIHFSPVIMLYIPVIFTGINSPNIFSVGDVYVDDARPKLSERFGRHWSYGFQGKSALGALFLRGISVWTNGPLAMALEGCRKFPPKLALVHGMALPSALSGPTARPPYRAIGYSYTLSHLCFSGFAGYIAVYTPPNLPYCSRGEGGGSGYRSSKPRSGGVSRNTRVSLR